MGDLNSEGRGDAPLVIGSLQWRSPGRAKRWRSRSCIWNATGGLRKVATNVRLLTCDPYGAAPGYLRAKPGASTVVDPGGDGEAATEYRFVDDKRGQEWITVSLLRRVLNAGTSRIDR